MICDLLIRKDMSTAFNEALIDSGIQVNIYRENKDYDWEAEIITKEHDDKVIAKFIDEAIEKYKKYNCLICKRKDEEYCTVGKCTIAFLEQLKEQTK